MRYHTVDLFPECKTLRALTVILGSLPADSESEREGTRVGQISRFSNAARRVLLNKYIFIFSSLYVWERSQADTPTHKLKILSFAGHTHSMWAMHVRKRLPYIECACQLSRFLTPPQCAQLAPYQNHGPQTRPISTPGI